MSTATHHPTTIRSITAETQDAAVLELTRPDVDFTHRSGQHVSLKVEVDGKTIYRTYSLCVPAGNGSLELGVRLLPNGLFSQWLQKQQPGQELAVDRPQGLFYLRPLQHGRQRNLFIAAGSGITPVMAMLEDMLVANNEASACLLYANRSFASTMFTGRLMNLKNSYMPRLDVHFFTTREAQRMPWRNTRINAASLELLQEKGILAATDFQEIYICGPLPMMQECKEFFIKQEFAAKRIFTEHFASATPENSLASSAVVAAEEHLEPIAKIRIIHEGISRDFDYAKQDGNILNAARRNLIELPFSCTHGVCGTCRSKVVDGQVKMARNYALEEEDLNNGFVLTCQSKPVTPQVALLFDY